MFNELYYHNMFGRCELYYHNQKEMIWGEKDIFNKRGKLPSYRTINEKRGKRKYKDY